MSWSQWDYQCEAEADAQHCRRRAPADQLEQLRRVCGTCRHYTLRGYGSCGLVTSYPECLRDSSETCESWEGRP